MSGVNDVICTKHDKPCVKINVCPECEKELQRPTEPKNDIDAIYLYQEEIAGYKKELETLKRRVGEAPTAIVLTSGKIPSSPLGFYKDYELMKVALVEKLEDE